MGDRGAKSRPGSTAGSPPERDAFTNPEGFAYLARVPSRHPNTRLSRFERSDLQPLLQTAWDLDLLRAVERHRLLRSTHLIALGRRSRQATLRRLQRLFHAGYLDRPLAQLSWYARGSEPMVYALGAHGAKALQRAEGRPRTAARWDTKNQRLSRMFLAHTLAVSEVMVAFEVACRAAAGVRLVRLSEILGEAPEVTRELRLPFRWTVELRTRGGPLELGVQPDEVFGLRVHVDGSERPPTVYFFLEADRGTMPIGRRGLARSSFLRKLLAYEATWSSGIYRSHFGIQNFRVLTVTTSESRVGHLVAAVRSLQAAARIFLFTTHERLREASILGSVWTNGRGELVGLIRDNRSLESPARQGGGAFGSGPGTASTTPRLSSPNSASAALISALE